MVVEDLSSLNARLLEGNLPDTRSYYTAKDRRLDNTHIKDLLPQSISANDSKFRWQILKYIKVTIREKTYVIIHVRDVLTI